MEGGIEMKRKRGRPPLRLVQEREAARAKADEECIQEQRAPRMKRAIRSTTIRPGGNAEQDDGSLGAMGASMERGGRPSIIKCVLVLLLNELYGTSVGSGLNSIAR